jgi:hypothetical protein
MNFSKIDNILIGFFIFIFIGSIYLLANINKQDTRVKQANDIGKITNVKNNVRRKNINMITWHDVSESDAIQEDDVIFTNDKSSALLTFNDGSRLSIEGDSLIRLKDIKDSVEVVLEKGEIQINNQNKMLVSMDGKAKQNLGLSENSIFSLSNRDNNIEIQSIQGKAELADGGKIEDGENANISKGKLGKITSSLKISKGHIEEDNAYIEWSSDSKVKNFSIELSEDPLFTNSKKLDSANTSVKTPWNKPIAYVKVSSLDQSGKVLKSIRSKIYMKNQPKNKTANLEEEGLIDNVVKLFNKMLNNTKRLEKKQAH